MTWGRVGTNGGHRACCAALEPLGRPLEQRTTLYGRTTTLGRRLRPVDDDGLLARSEQGTPLGTPITLSPARDLSGAPTP